MNTENVTQPATPEAGQARALAVATGSVDLLPCPCCGSKEIELAYSPPPARGGPALWSLRCLQPKCELVMPAKLSELEVSRAWNRRFPDDSAIAKIRREIERDEAEDLARERELERLSQNIADEPQPSKT
jgi:hypothetical protein